ncbi:uncharacterized protein LOC117340257 [Pecten maximus]|uniref:uncharacterized protein LOC117340257 n=1 Tax=Pecten maximus TaxID=6579 RepID=UPI001458F043|nr:uncharacterized protein LOC117340257 [Pecten maximus]
MSCVSPYSYNTGLDSCLYLSAEEDKDTWEEADQFCQDIAGHLVVAETGSQQLALGALIGSNIGDYWVGASWDSNIGYYVWFSGFVMKTATPLTEGCLKIDDTGVFSVGDCGNDFKFVCESI